MIYAHVFLYSKHAEDAFKEFATECNPTKARKIGRCLFVAFVDGDEHWFMGEEAYSRWAMGRTYIHVGYEEQCHSKAPMQTKGATNE